MQNTAPSPKLAKAILVIIAILLFFIIGLALPNFGVQSLVPAILPIAALVILIRPDLGLLLTVAMIPIENVFVFGDEVTAVRLLGMYVAGAWALQKVLRREPWRPLLSSPLFKSTLPLLFLVAVSTAWATNPASAYDGLFQLLRMILLGLLVLDLANSQKRIDWLIKAVVIGGLVAASLVLNQYYNEHAVRAGDEIAGGVNGTAALLVLIVQFAFYLIRSQAGRFWRWLGVVYITMAIVAVLVTFSRTSYVLLSLVLAINYWETIKNRKLFLPLIFTVIALVIIGRNLLPQDVIDFRVKTMFPYFQQTFSKSGEETSARGFAWRVGLAMFRSNPLWGVGYGSFNDAYRDYRTDVTNTVIRMGSRRSAHNVYIAFLAELGMFGLILWLITLFAGLPRLIKAYNQCSKDKSSRQWIIVQTVLYCFLIEVSYGWAIDIVTDKMLWFLLGLSMAVSGLVSKEHQSDPIEKLIPTKTSKGKYEKRLGTVDYSR